jgi:hypothetical protein
MQPCFVSRNACKGTTLSLRTHPYLTCKLVYKATRQPAHLHNTHHQACCLVDGITMFTLASAADRAWQYMRTLLKRALVAILMCRALVFTRATQAVLSFGALTVGFCALLLCVAPHRRLQV